MKRLWSLIGLLAVLAMGVAACGGGSGQQQGSAAGGGQAGGGQAGGGPKQFDKVVMGTVSNMMHTGEYVALEKGFYAENGLDVKLKIFASGSDLNKALAAGDIQFGTASTTSVPASRAAGLLTRLVGPVMNDATTVDYAGPLGIVGRKDRGITSDPSSLKGKRIGVLTGSTTETYLQLFLKAHGMKPGDVKEVNLDVPDHPVSLKQGDVDAAASWEPYVQQEVTELGSNAAVVSRGDPLLGYIIGVGATDKTIQDKAILTKFVSAIAEADQYLRRHPQQGAVVASHFIKGLDIKDATEALRSHLKFDPRISGCTKKAFAEGAKSLVKAGEIKQAPPVDDMLSPEIVAAVEKQHPDWFSDLPPIPDSCGQ